MKRFANSGLLLSVMFAMVWAGCGGRVEVETVSPHRGLIRESFTEPAQTRLEMTYMITMPISGRIGRIDLEPGDPVKAGQELVPFDRRPLEQEVLEAARAVEELEAQITLKEDDRLEMTALEEANAAVEAAGEALKAADAQVDAERARHEHAEREQARSRTLAETAKISQSELDASQLAAETALIELRKQEFTRAALNALIIAVKLGPRAINEYMGRKTLERHVIEKQLLQARSRLDRAQYRLDLAVVRSPADGVVLEKHEQGSGFLAAGAVLLSVGDLAELEAESDVLTQDALSLTPGAEVEFRPARGLGVIAGKVKRVEPAGFTKLSSLGVEQQRVRVIVTLDRNPERLGVGYRLRARFFTASKPDALIVPRYSVLQAPDGSYYVFEVVQGKLQKQTVTLGLRSDLDLEVTGGISEKNLIVAAPDTMMKTGAKVRLAKRP